jgi:hypothetical protein
MLLSEKRGYSDHISGPQYEKARSAIDFAHARGCPMTLTVSINWTRTDAGDDPQGMILDKMMEATRKWLKRNGVAVFAQVEVRERPDDPDPVPNAHVMLHCPHELIAAFKRFYRKALRGRCGVLRDKALVFETIGGGNPTLTAALGQLYYLSKGIDPVQAKKHGIRPEPQGRVFGKRISVSQDIGPAARRRHAAGSTVGIATLLEKVAHAA